MKKLFSGLLLAGFSFCVFGCNALTSYVSSGTLGMQMMYGTPVLLDIYIEEEVDIVSDHVKGINVTETTETTTTEETTTTTEETTTTTEETTTTTIETREFKTKNIELGKTEILVLELICINQYDLVNVKISDSRYDEDCIYTTTSETYHISSHVVNPDFDTIHYDAYKTIIKLEIPATNINETRSIEVTEINYFGTIPLVSNSGAMDIPTRIDCINLYKLVIEEH